LTDIANILGKPYFQALNCLIYNKEYDKSLVLDEYVNWCEQWIAEVYRVTIDRGAFWLNLGYLSIRDRAKAIGISYLLWDKVPFYLIQEVVWNYGAPVAGSKFFSPRN
jgi:adenine-specific DNA-methyltransferase